MPLKHTEAWHKTSSQRDQYVERIRRFEHDGDEIVRRTLEKLDTSFITPFDREDIQNLVNRMDDVIDQIDAASKRLKLDPLVKTSLDFASMARNVLCFAGDGTR